MVRGVDEVVPGMAEAIERRARAMGLAEVGRFADMVGVTRQGLTPIRKGLRRQYEARTLVGVAEALRWPLDWYDRLVDGDDPATFETVDHAPRPRTIEERVRAVETHLAEIQEQLERLAPPAGERGERR